MPIPGSDQQPIVRRLLREEAHDAIRAAILEGTFAPGERLDDNALQRWLGVSRTPIREALNLLALEGFVEIGAQSHTRVVKPDAETVEEAVQTLGVLMGGLARVAIGAMTEQQLAQALAAIEDGIAAVESRDQRQNVAAVRRVYDALLEGCRNKVLAKLIRTNSLTLIFQVTSSADMREPNWDLLAQGWERLRTAVELRDSIAVELALEEMHRLPSPGGHWAEARWTSV